MKLYPMILLAIAVTTTGAAADEQAPATQRARLGNIEMT